MRRIVLDRKASAVVLEGGLDLAATARTAVDIGAGQRL